MKLLGLAASLCVIQVAGTMARNEEKAQALLNKWTSMKRDYNQGPKDRRPFLASDCDDLSEAEKWRREVIKETSKKVQMIQNAGLGEHRIRDMNDQINKLLREKGHWQRRIKELGGPDYGRSEPKSYDADGRELPGSGGYKYFGAAKDLPGVKELFVEAAPEAMRRTRRDMYKGIDPDYYGYRDEDDGVLVAKEAEVEKTAIEEAVQEFQAKRQKLLEERRLAAAINKETLPDHLSDEEDDEEEGMLVESLATEASAATSASVKAHVPVPSQEEIGKVLLERKKASLLSQLFESSN